MLPPDGRAGERFCPAAQHGLALPGFDDWSIANALANPFLVRSCLTTIRTGLGAGFIQGQGALEGSPRNESELLNCNLRFWRVAGYPATPVAGEDAGFGEEVKCPVSSNALNHPAVVEEAVGRDADHRLQTSLDSILGYRTQEICP